MPRLRAALICAVFCVGSLSACGDDGGIDTTATSTTSPPTTISTAGGPSTTVTTAATSATTPLLSTTTATTYPWDTIAVPATVRCVVDHLPGDALNVRSGPSGDYPVIGTLAFNATEVATTGVGAEDDSDRVWAEIDYDGGSGWVASWFLTPGECGPASAGPFCVVDTACTDRLNVRSGPGTGFDVIGSLAHDATGVAGTGWAAVGGPDEMWTQIAWGSGVGWVASWFLTGAPCSASAGEPCSCDSGGYAFIHSVDTIGRFLEYDPVMWVWVGPADTDYEWDNSDPTVYWLPLDDELTINACPADMSGSFPPMLYCQPDELVEHSPAAFAVWITDGTEVGQNRRWLGDVPGHTGQFWSIVVEGCSVTEINGMWFP